MALFSVNTDKCAKDGICAAECPLGIISVEHGFPEPVPGADKLCINCGHCVAVCPHGAMSLATMEAANCERLERSLLPEARQLSHLVRARRSIRVYKNKPVEREKLTRLIDTARYAPTAKNTQLLSWLVISRKQELEKLCSLAIDWMRELLAKKDPMVKTFGLSRVVAAWEQGYDPILRSAPCLVVTFAPKAYAGGVVDSTIGLTTLELAAVTEGLGTCWAGFFFIAASQWPPLQEALELPGKQAVTGSMMIGYPKFQYHRIPARNAAKVTWR